MKIKLNFSIHLTLLILVITTSAQAQIAKNSTLDMDPLAKICSGDYRTEELNFAIHQCTDSMLAVHYVELDTLEKQYDDLTNKLNSEIRQSGEYKAKINIQTTGAVLGGMVTTLGAVSVTIKSMATGLQSVLRDGFFQKAIPAVIVTSSLALLAANSAYNNSVELEISKSNIEQFKLLVGLIKQEIETRKVKIAGLAAMKKSFEKK